jgi:DNA-binding beta-propeller fold protein YncE
LWASAPSPRGDNLYTASGPLDGGGAVAAFRRSSTNGALTQLSGKAACISETGNGRQCRDGVGLAGVVSVAVSPDGKNVYAATVESQGVAALARKTTNGVLTQLAGRAGCTTETGTGGACADGKALARPTWVTVSPDGKSVYVTSSRSNAVAVFARDATTGALAQLPGKAGCVSEDGTGGACAVGKAIGAPTAVAVSPDSSHVYVTSHARGAVAVFKRDSTTGVLTQLAGTAGCVSETGSGGTCADGKALSGAHGLTVSPGGRSVYVASELSNAVAVFLRNATTGALTQLGGTAGCVSDNGTNGACADGRALVAPQEVAVSPDRASVYVASVQSHALDVFARASTNGALTQLAGKAGCVSENGTNGACTDGKALGLPDGVTVSPDGKSVYAASFLSNAVAVFARAP